MLHVACQNNMVEVVKLLLEQPSIDVNIIQEISFFNVKNFNLYM